MKMKRLHLTLFAILSAFSAMAAGNGTLENPYSVDEIISQGLPPEAVTNTYVKGYIVGNVPSASYNETIFEAPFSNAANIVLASSSSETDIEYCIPVQLPSGDIRKALNLVDNPHNLGHEILLCGSHEKYFAQNGLKAVDYYQWIDAPMVEVVDPDPIPDPLPEGCAYIGLNPESPECDWTFENLSLSGDITYVWAWKEYNGACWLNGSAYYNGTANAAEALAISPIIDLAGWTSLTASFDHAAKFQTNLKEQCRLLIREEGTTQWVALTFSVWPASGTWAWINSGEVSLAGWEGKRVQFAFKYGSTAANADNWEIRNFVVNGIKSNYPEPPVMPGMNLLTMRYSHGLTTTQFVPENTPVMLGISGNDDWKIAEISGSPVEVDENGFFVIPGAASDRELEVTMEYAGETILVDHTAEVIGIGDNEVKIIREEGYIILDGLVSQTEIALYTLDGLLLQKFQSQGTTARLHMGEGCCILVAGGKAYKFLH